MGTKPYRQGRPIRHRGTVLSPLQVQSIRQVVRRHPQDRTRAEVARRVCRYLGWRRPNGELAERSCMDLLLRLAERGLVREAWISGHTVLRNARLALDGKTLCGDRDGEDPPVQLLSALLHNEGLVVAQSRVSSKTNEIPIAQSMLRRLDIEGSVVTGDALHTQRETAEIIVTEKKANYVFTVKNNQPTLRKDIEDLDWGSFSPSGRNGR